MRSRTRSFSASPLSWALLCVLFVPYAAPGQSRPDSGRVLEQVAPEPRPPAPSAVELEVEDRPAITLPAGETVAVTRIRITGATRFAAEQLHANIAEGEGKTLSLAALQELAQRLTHFYRERGYLLTRAYLPAQQIDGGVVEIAVLEGRLSQLHVDDAVGLKGAALAPLQRIPIGQPLTRNALERALLLATDLPGATIKSTLTPGAAVGTSDLLTEVAPGRRFGGSVSADTYGNRHTGSFRSGIDLDFNNPLNVGDQLSLNALLSLEDLYHVRARYQLPANRWGSRVGLSYAWMDYALGEQFAALDADGTANIASLYLQHPFVRSRRFNLYGQLQYDHKQLEDRLGAFRTESDKQLRNWTLGVSGDFLDRGGRGTNAFSLGYTRGRLSLDSFSRAIDAVSAETQGHFGKWNLGYQRLQALTPAIGVYLSYAGQFADGNLDSAEKLSLGGAYGVRAYPQGEAPADETHLLTVEARLRMPVGLPGDWQLTSFLDHGQARANDAPWSAGDNHRELTGAGVGLHIDALTRWSLKASLAWRLGDERPTSDSDKSPRLWLNAATHF
jgi:hemolysin activation/secretion protein